MEYISAEEFLKQPEEVQKVFINYTSKLNDWETSLFSARDEKFRKSKFPLLGSQIDFFVNEYGKDIIPLLTEGQLREFIQDKTGCKNVEILSDIEAEEYYCDLYKRLSSGTEYKHFTRLGNDKFKAYWKVALEVAKEV